MSLQKITRTALAVLALVAMSCSQSERKETVVVYTALDQIFSERVFSAFEKETGVTVEAVYDTEATKTVGLVNRIIAEAKNPQCDVFWNNEIVRTVMLEKKGLLQPYASPSARDIPDGMKDADGYWAGFAARARILIYNTNLLEPSELPASILELTQPAWQGRFSLAYPLFGTTATHAAALFVHWGGELAREYFAALEANDVLIVDGNASSKDAVARGEVPIGFTDTDDANIAIEQGKPVAMHLPDQGEGAMGTLVIPNTVSLIKSCPHPEAGKKLIDFLLSRETEKMLAFGGSAQMPVRADIAVPEGALSINDITTMDVDWDEVESRLTDVSLFMEALFVR